MIKFSLTPMLRRIVHFLKRRYGIPRLNLKRIPPFMLFNSYCDYLVKKSLKLNKSLDYNGEISGQKVTYDKYWDVLIHFEESTGCTLTPDMSKASIALMWGTTYSPKRCMFLRSVIKRRLPFVIVEDGFIRSIMPLTRHTKALPKEKTDGLSYIVDHKGIYFDAQKGSIINDFLNSEWQITSEQMKSTANAMAYIIEKSLSKYNIVKPETINFNNNNTYSSVVLVVDQCKGDKSVSGANADSKSFQRMRRVLLIKILAV